MRKLMTCGLLWLAGTAAASAQSVITNIERNAQGRVSTVTSTSDRGTVRTEFVHSGSRTQATTTAPTAAITRWVRVVINPSVADRSF